MCTDIFNLYYLPPTANSGSLFLILKEKNEYNIMNFKPFSYLFEKFDCCFSLTKKKIIKKCQMNITRKLFIQLRQDIIWGYVCSNFYMCVTLYYMLRSSFFIHAVESYGRILLSSTKNTLWLRGLNEFWNHCKWLTEIKITRS